MVSRSSSMSYSQFLYELENYEDPSDFDPFADPTMEEVPATEIVDQNFDVDPALGGFHSSTATSSNSRPSSFRNLTPASIWPDSEGNDEGLSRYNHITNSPIYKLRVAVNNVFDVLENIEKMIITICEKVTTAFNQISSIFLIVSEKTDPKFARVLGFVIGLIICNLLTSSIVFIVKTTLMFSFAYLFATYFANIVNSSGSRSEHFENSETSSELYFELDSMAESKNHS